MKHNKVLDGKVKTESRAKLVRQNLLHVQKASRNKYCDCLRMQQPIACFLLGDASVNEDDILFIHQCTCEGSRTQILL